MTTLASMGIAAGGDPTDEEMAAIMAATSAVLVGPHAQAAGPERPPRWRFSGRWWVKPVPLRRRRPW